MSTPAEVMDMVASLLNDTAQAIYTNTAQLPYLNMALEELQEEFQLNNVPVTNETSGVLIVEEGETDIGGPTGPSLPGDLVEIQKLSERTNGADNSFIQMSKRDFLPEFAEITSQLIYWSWQSGHIKLLGANTDIDVKLNYIRNIFPSVELGQINTNLDVRLSKQYLGYKTAALCAMFIMSDPERATALDSQSINALDRSLGISTKGRQSIITRRRPFRSAYKRQGIILR